MIKGSETTKNNILSRTVKAALATALMGAAWLFIGFITSMMPIDYPSYSTFFEVLVGAMLIFTFATTFCEGTIYKYFFIIIRAFFLTIYIVYASNFGLISLPYGNFNITVEFMPIVGLFVIANLLEAAKGLIQAIEFASQKG
ncbi:hypothetical protein H5T51_03275 [Candidatus Bathyarchaeota archaeon]|nr:hypothetical protein [Candidatus Bathyarchaeota archaeon]